MQGYILTSEIDGTIQMKSYLTGNPEIRVALNDDLSLERGGRSIHGNCITLQSDFGMLFSHLIHVIF